MAVLAQKPPKGWNSWNTFGAHINEQLIMEMADTMVAEGYKEAGYEYVIIDDCWSLKAVSYTHLDVYKRQVRHWLCQGK